MFSFLHSLSEISSLREDLQRISPKVSNKTEDTSSDKCEDPLQLQDIVVAKKLSEGPWLSRISSVILLSVSK